MLRLDTCDEQLPAPTDGGGISVVGMATWLLQRPKINRVCLRKGDSLYVHRQFATGIEQLHKASLFELVLRCMRDSARTRQWMYLP